MKKLFFAILPLALALSIGCCQLPQNPPAPPTAEEILRSKVDFAPLDLAIESIRAGVGPESQLLEVHLTFLNRQKSDTVYRYKTVWFDEAGAPLAGADSGWRGVTMNRGSNPLRIVAGDDRAADFKITIEKSD